jgi:hypothetical protein
MKLACARLSINHLNTRPYSAESKGYVKLYIINMDFHEKN